MRNMNRGTGEVRGALFFRSVIAATAAASLLSITLPSFAAEPAAKAKPAPSAATNADAPDAAVPDDATKPAKPALPKLPPPPGAKKLSPAFDVWIDPKEGVVICDGEVCLREGYLEMFSCTKNTKEHEAIVSANTQAYLVHAALLSLGAKAGHPAIFVPKYQPAEGTEVEVEVHWRDAQGKEQKARAQDWIQDMKTDKAMKYPFVFGGSRFWKDPDTGKEYYQAEGGDFICVSNFGTAMLDLPVESSQSNDSLEFKAFTERIPPVGTPVRLIFRPKLEKKDKKAEGEVPKEIGASGEAKAEGVKENAK